MRILVCGGRDFASYLLLANVLSEYGSDVELCNGGARGADSLAGKYAAIRGIPVRVFPADWQTHGKAAGPIRNSEMLREFAPDLVVAFPGGRGTSDMVAKAKRAGVQVREVPSPSPAKEEAMARFRFIHCHVCHGTGTTFCTVDGRPEPTGCIPCGGNKLEIGSGVIGVTFERNQRVDDALRAHSGKEQ
jgi:hypothetical protein